MLIYLFKNCVPGTVLDTIYLLENIIEMVLGAYSIMEEIDNNQVKRQVYN